MEIHGILTEASESSRGWKEYVAILVKGGRIFSGEYYAENASGFVESWDYAHTRYYAAPRVKGQGEIRIDVITGAFSSHRTFRVFSQAFLVQVRGDRVLEYII